MAYTGEIALLASEYRQKGRIEAAAHRPPSDALNPDQHEVTLRSVANGHINTSQRLFEAEVGDAARSAAEIHRRISDLENGVNQILNDNSLESTVQVKMADRQAELANFVEDRIKAEVQYKDFRAKNQIAAEPHYPDSHVWHFAIVGLCFLGETTANAIFFSNSAGLLAGYGVAIGIAAVNIVSAMALGMGFRFKNVAAPELKALGWGCLILFLGLSIYLNALFASYRSEYQLLVDPGDPAALGHAFVDASGIAIRVFVLDMRIADLTSFLLFGFGILLSGLAFWKGYTFDDKYPEQGRLHRHLVSMRERETKLYAVLRDEVSAIILQYRNRINSTLNEPGELQTRSNAKRAALSSALSAITHDLRAVQNDHHLVLDAYRQQNTAIRGTSPPAYFTSVEPLLAADYAAIAAPKLEELDNCQHEASALRDRVQPPLNAKLEGVNQLATALMTDGFSRFTEKVEQSAKNNISRNTPTISRAN